MQWDKIIVIFLVSTFFFYSCEVIGGIYKAGFYSAIILGVLIVVLIVWLMNRNKSGN